MPPESIFGTKKVKKRWRNGVYSTEILKIRIFGVRHGGAYFRERNTGPHSNLAGFFRSPDFVDLKLIESQMIHTVSQR